MSAIERHSTGSSAIFVHAVNLSNVLFTRFDTACSWSLISSIFRDSAVRAFRAYSLRRNSLSWKMAVIVRERVCLPARRRSCERFPSLCWVLRLPRWWPAVSETLFLSLVAMNSRDCDRLEILISSKILTIAALARRRGVRGRP